MNEYLSNRIFIYNCFCILKFSCNYQLYFCTTSHKYLFNFFVIINSLLKSHIFNKFIATINISFDRMKTLIVIIIARNNLIKNNIILYSKTTKYLNNLTKRLKINIQINVEKTNILKECFKT